MKVWLLLSKAWYPCWESRTTTFTSQGHLQNPVTKSRNLGKDFDYADVYGVDADGLWDCMEEENFEEI